MRLGTADAMLGITRFACRNDGSVDKKVPRGEGAAEASSSAPKNPGFGSECERNVGCMFYKPVEPAMRYYMMKISLGAET